ncbi:MAG TPA: RNA methyltransferase substrate-binding domain-containing protein, partial [Verrucomicrobiae bacterium]|nr:RNA methyltransferase substrate-binding domain-containing protein [Verrucomicrobiae bacterium]
MEEMVFGRNSVLESLKSGRPVNKLLVARGATTGSIREIIGMAKGKGLPVQEVDRKVLDTAAGDTHHQGVLLYLAPKGYVELEDIIQIAQGKGEPPFILVLDEIEDPHNLGALLRTADAAGVHGVVIPKRRAVGLTGAVAKASAGAVEHVAVARVANLTQAI